MQRSFKPRCSLNLQMTSRTDGAQGARSGNLLWVSETGKTESVAAVFVYRHINRPVFLLKPKRKPNPNKPVEPAGDQFLPVIGDRTLLVEQIAQVNHRSPLAWY